MRLLNGPSSVPLAVGDTDGGRRGDPVTFMYYYPATPPEIQRAVPNSATTALDYRLPPSGMVKVPLWQCPISPPVPRVLRASLAGLGSLVLPE